MGSSTGRLGVGSTSRWDHTQCPRRSFQLRDPVPVDGPPCDKPLPSTVQARGKTCCLLDVVALLVCTLSLLPAEETLT